MRTRCTTTNVSFLYRVCARVVLTGREVYVRELQKHIEVDVYGSCGELKCSIESIEECYTEVLRPTYKFYLAFENNLCEDYVTEKVRKGEAGVKCNILKKKLEIPLRKRYMLKNFCSYGPW